MDKIVREIQKMLEELEIELRWLLAGLENQSSSVWYILEYIQRILDTYPELNFDNGIPTEVSCDDKISLQVHIGAMKTNKKCIAGKLNTRGRVCSRIVNVTSFCMKLVEMMMEMQRNLQDMHDMRTNMLLLDTNGDADLFSRELDRLFSSIKQKRVENEKLDIAIEKLVKQGLNHPDTTRKRKSPA